MFITILTSHRQFVMCIGPPTHISCIHEHITNSQSADYLKLVNDSHPVEYIAMPSATSSSARPLQCLWQVRDRSLCHRDFVTAARYLVHPKDT